MALFKKGSNLAIIEIIDPLFSWIEKNQTKEKNADEVKHWTSELSEGENRFKLVAEANRHWKSIDFSLVVNDRNATLSSPVLADNLKDKLNVTFNRPSATPGRMHILITDKNISDNETKAALGLKVLNLVVTKEAMPGATFKIYIEKG